MLVKNKPVLYSEESLRLFMHNYQGFSSIKLSESVSKVMAQTHEIGGSTVAVDEATAKVSMSIQLPCIYIQVVLLDLCPLFVG
jgi:hypothetical protein